MTFTIRTATRGDLPEVLRVQRHAFARTAADLSLDPERMPPLREEVHDLDRLLAEGTLFLVAVTPTSQIVGTVRAAEREGVVEIGRLAVDTGWTRQGIAEELMLDLELRFPEAHTFTLFTGAEARVPLALYNKLGYRITHSEQHEHTRVVWLCKAIDRQ